MSVFNVTIHRRTILAQAGKLTGVAAAAGIFGGAIALPFSANATAPKLEPEEKVEQTLKRMFGNRKIQDGAAMMKLDTQLIAENGSVVPVKVDINIEPTAQKYVKTVYFIADKNRRPLSARFNVSPAMGKPMIEANVRLGESTDFRAIAEMNDGSLFEVKQAIKVTVGGCGG